MRTILIILAVLAALVGLAAYGPGSLNAMAFSPSPPDPGLDAYFETGVGR